MTEFFQYLGLIGFGGIIGIIIKHFLDKDKEIKFFKLSFEREEFFKLQEKLEIVFNGLNFYNSTVNIISRSIQDGNHFEKDFTIEEIQKRMGENYQKSQELLFLYFNNIYDDFLNLIKLYKEIVNFYFNNILGAPKNGLDLDYSKEDILKLSDKLNDYGKKQKVFLNKLKNEVNKKRELLIK